MTPISAKNTSVIEMLAALKRRLRKTRTSSIGCGVCRSQAMKAAMIAAPSANAVRMIELVQPRSGASISAHTIADRPAIERTMPGKSRRGDSGSRESGISIAPAIRQPATTGRLTRKTMPQSKCSISQPPVIGPIAMPIPDTAAQIAIAFGRSSLGKMLVRIDSVVGMIAAAPTPIRAREAISSVELPEIDANSDPSPKIPRPTKSARLRPKRSPRVPAASRRPANTSR